MWAAHQNTSHVISARCKVDVVRASFGIFPQLTDRSDDRRASAVSFNGEDCWTTERTDY